MSRGRESSVPPRRAELMAAARAIFAERGYHETTVEDITRAAGVAKGTFYLYFQDNRALARLAYRESMGMDPALETMIRDVYRETAEIEAQNIRVAQQLGLLRDCDPLLTAFAHIGMVERVLLTMLEAPSMFPEPTEVIRQMMRLAYEGLRAEGAPVLSAM